MAMADYVVWFLCVLVSLLFFGPMIVMSCRESAQQRAAAAEQGAALAQLRLAALATVQLASPVVVPAPAVAKKLGYFPFSGEGRSASEELVCAICLREFEHGQECSEVPACRHLFHRDCIDVWMKTKTTCPLCRGDIVAGSSERVSAADDMV